MEKIFKDAVNEHCESFNKVTGSHMAVTDRLKGQVEAERQLKEKYKLDADQLAQKVMSLEARKIHDEERMEWMTVQIGCLNQELEIAKSVLREMEKTPPITPPPASPVEGDVVVEIEKDLNQMLNEVLIEADNNYNKRSAEELEVDYPISVTHYKRAHHKTLTAQTPREALSQTIRETLNHEGPMGTKESVAQRRKESSRMARMAVQDKIAPPKDQKVMNRTVSKFDLLK